MFQYLHDIWIKEVCSLWCRNVGVSDKGKQLETAFIVIIGNSRSTFKRDSIPLPKSRIEGLAKTDTKTIKHKNLTLVHTTTVTSEDYWKSQLLFGLHITEMTLWEEYWLS